MDPKENQREKEKSKSTDAIITSRSSIDAVEDTQSSKDDRDDTRYHLSGLRLHIIVLALCLSVILVALVGVRTLSWTTSAHIFRTMLSLLLYGTLHNSREVLLIMMAGDSNYHVCI